MQGRKVFLVAPHIRLSAATRRDQKWIDEALASGPEERFCKEKFDAALKFGLEKAKPKSGLMELITRPTS